MQVTRDKGAADGGAFLPSAMKRTALRPIAE
jgi:hypothetical protein